jgi:hypothetical protein
MALDKISCGNNVSQITANFIDCALALQGSGADKALAQFITDNTGIVMTFCERLVDLRNNEIEESTIEPLLAGVFSERTKVHDSVDEYRGVCVDRRNGRFALAKNVPAEHRGTLDDNMIVAIRYNLNHRAG